MKTLEFAWALAVLGLVVAPTTSMGAEASAELKALHAVDQNWVKAYNAGDVDGVANLYAEDAILLPPGVPSAVGKAAIRAFFAKDIAAANKEGIKFSLDPNPSGGVSANVGWVSGTYTVKDATGNVVERGKYLSVSKKTGGKWLYLRDTWNADASPAPAATASGK